jgi:hypothetical protein
MRKYGGWGVLAMAFALTSMRTEAQETVTIEDVRCVVIGMRLSGGSNAADETRGIWMTLYYLGRLDGRVPKLDIENLLIQESKKMTASDYASAMKRCGAGLVGKGEQITKIGKDLIKRQESMSTH